MLTSELPKVLTWVDLGVHVVDDACCCEDTLWGCANGLCVCEKSVTRRGWSVSEMDESANDGGISDEVKAVMVPCY